MEYDPIDRTKPESFDDVKRLMMAIFGDNAQIGEDNDGQLVVYTGQRFKSDGTLVTFE